MMALFGCVGIFVMLVSLTSLLQRPRGAASAALFVGAVMFGLAVGACSLSVDVNGVHAVVGG